MHALHSHGQRNQSDLKANTCRLQQGRETRVPRVTVPEWREIFSQSHGVRVGLSIIKTCSDNQDKSNNMRQNEERMVVVKDTKSREDRRHVCSFVLISTRRPLQRDYDTTIDINSKTTNSYPRRESKAEIKTNNNNGFRVVINLANVTVKFSYTS